MRNTDKLAACRTCSLLTESTPNSECRSEKLLNFALYYRQQKNNLPAPVGKVVYNGEECVLCRRQCMCCSVFWV